jgi:hypothetical protein
LLLFSDDALLLNPRGVGGVLLVFGDSGGTSSFVVVDAVAASGGDDITFSADERVSSVLCALISGLSYKHALRRYSFFSNRFSRWCYGKSDASLQLGCFVVYSHHHFLTLLLLLVVVPSVLDILHLLLQQQHVRWIVKNIPSTEAAADNPCSATLLPFPYTNSQRVKKKKGGGEGENYSVCCITDHDHSK